MKDAYSAVALRALFNALTEELESEKKKVIELTNEIESLKSDLKSSLIERQNMKQQVIDIKNSRKQVQTVPVAQ
jgi:hypothetical protein